MVNDGLLCSTLNLTLTLPALDLIRCVQSYYPPINGALLHKIRYVVESSLKLPVNWMCSGVEKTKKETFCCWEKKHFVTHGSAKLPTTAANSAKATWLPLWSCYLPYLMTFSSKKAIKPRLWFLNMPRCWRDWFLKAHCSHVRAGDRINITDNQRCMENRCHTWDSLTSFYVIYISFPMGCHPYRHPAAGCHMLLRQNTYN